METITIGNKPLKEITQYDLLEICKKESVHLVFEYKGESVWGQPEVLDFDNTMFSDTVVIDYKQKRISDGLEGRFIVFFFNHVDFSWHWHFKDEDKTRESKRLRIESIKYLVQNGYDVPLY